MKKLETCLTLAMSVITPSFCAQTPCTHVIASDSQAVVAAKSDRGPSVLAETVLRTDISSGKTKAGQEVKLSVAKPVDFGNGIKLPRNTVIVGHIEKVSAHSKTLPNGIISLVIDRAEPKGGTPLLVEAQIRELNPSEESMRKTELPNASRSIGGTSNAGGGAQLAFEMNDHNPLRSNVDGTGLDGVYLEHLSGSSGVVLSPGSNVYLDSGTIVLLQITLKSR